MPEGMPFRVLSLDGGGLRGTYTATYLTCVADAFAKKRGLRELDIGKAFDLVVGTSTGAIIACALADGLTLSKVTELYKDHGKAIFCRKLPTGIWSAISDSWFRQSALKSGARALQDALKKQFKDRTLIDLYKKRGIALAITAVELSQHRSWVFKTPHLKTKTNHRDNEYKVVDICMATTAAPIYRSLAAIPYPRDEETGYHVFADGGLWANNPVLVGLIDALEMAEPGRSIEVFSLGSCPRPAGERIQKDDIHRGLKQWNYGGDVAALSIDAQEFAYDNMARMLAKHVNRECKVVRFPRGQIPAALNRFLELDDSSASAFEELVKQARTDADMTNSRCGATEDEEGSLICRLFMDAPEAL